MINRTSYLRGAAGRDRLSLVGISSRHLPSTGIGTSGSRLRTPIERNLRQSWLKDWRNCGVPALRSANVRASRKTLNATWGHGQERSEVAGTSSNCGRNGWVKSKNNSRTAGYEGDEHEAIGSVTMSVAQGENGVNRGAMHGLKRGEQHQGITNDLGKTGATWVDGEAVGAVRRKTSLRTVSFFP